MPCSSLLLNPVYNRLNQVHIFVLTAPECYKFCPQHSRFQRDNINTKLYRNPVDSLDIKPAAPARTLFRWPAQCYIGHASCKDANMRCSGYEMMQRGSDSLFLVRQCDSKTEWMKYVSLLITIRSKISIKKTKIVCIAGNASLAAVLVGIELAILNFQ